MDNKDTSVEIVQASLIQKLPQFEYDNEKKRISIDLGNLEVDQIQDDHVIDQTMDELNPEQDKQDGQTLSTIQTGVQETQKQEDVKETQEQESMQVTQKQKDVQASVTEIYVEDDQKKAEDSKGEIKPDVIETQKESDGQETETEDKELGQTSRQELRKTATQEQLKIRKSLEPQKLLSSASLLRTKPKSQDRIKIKKSLSLREQAQNAKSTESLRKRHEEFGGKSLPSSQGVLIAETGKSMDSVEASRKSASRRSILEMREQRASRTEKNDDKTIRGSSENQQIGSSQSLPNDERDKSTPKSSKQDIRGVHIQEDTTLEATDEVIQPDEDGKSPTKTSDEKHLKYVEDSDGMEPTRLPSEKKLRFGAEDMKKKEVVYGRHGMRLEYKKGPRICEKFLKVKEFAEILVDGIMEEAIGKRKDFQQQSAIKVVEGLEYMVDTSESTSITSVGTYICVFEWPTIEEFTPQIGCNKIEEYLSYWKLEENWKHCINYLEGDSDKACDFHRFEAIFSIPCKQYPIPQATASLYFTFEVSRVRPKDCNVDVYFWFEGQRTIFTPGKVRLQESWLFNIVDAKIKFFKTITF